MTIDKSIKNIKLPELMYICAQEMGSSRLKSRRRQDQGSKWARVAMGILATIGAIDTGSITLNRWGWLGNLSCPGGAEGCDKVLNSAWGTIAFGNFIELPLSFFGLASYITVLAMAILPLLPNLSKNKTNISRKTWWILFVLTVIMAVFSLILIGLMVIKIQAFCFFCLLSAFISISLLTITLIGGGWDDPGELLFRGFILSTVVLLAGLIWASSVDPNRPKDSSDLAGTPPIVQTVSTSSAIELAKHLKVSGVIMYSAYWCPHCHEQKEMFGKEAAKELVIIECAADGKNNKHTLCATKGIDGYPSWEINGEMSSGIKRLKELAEMTAYSGPKKF